MSKVQEQVSQAEVMEALTKLRADFPDWVFQRILPDTIELCWEARRLPFRYPRGGGISWVRAESAERLRVFLNATVRIEAEIESS